MAIVADSVVELRCLQEIWNNVRLKPKQIEAIQSFVNGNDVFCCLPTGYGNLGSLCAISIYRLIHPNLVIPEHPRSRSQACETTLCHAHTRDFFATSNLADGAR